MTDLTDLELKAKAAVWIQWPTNPEDETFVEDLGDDACAFIAVASPVTVLALLEEVARLKRGLMGAAMFAKPPSEREKELRVEVEALKKEIALRKVWDYREGDP